MATVSRGHSRLTVNGHGAALSQAAANPPRSWFLRERLECLNAR